MRHLLLAIILLPMVLITTSHFFCFIQDCKGGTAMNDWVLKWLTPRDVSIPIALLMATVLGLCVVRCVTDPNMFITALLAFVFLFATRMITINITRLVAPIGLIELKDPICNLMYGSHFITKDLFYSGHTATLCVLYLCSTKKIDKYFILFAVLSVGTLLLIQHVHYTVDVLCAPLFAFGCFWLSKRIMNMQKAYIKSV